MNLVCDGMTCSISPAKFIDNTVQNQYASGLDNTNLIIPQFFKVINQDYDPNSHVGIYINGKRVISAEQLPFDFSKPWIARKVIVHRPEFAEQKFGLSQGVIEIIDPTNDSSLFKKYEEESTVENALTPERIKTGGRRTLDDLFEEAHSCQEIPVDLSNEEIRSENSFNALESKELDKDCLLYTSPSPRDKRQSRMPSSA